MNEKHKQPSLPDRVAAWREDLDAASLLDGQDGAALDQAISEARAGRIHQPPPPLLTILLLGATGGGKSALLNALAGENIARSHHLRPTTSRPTVYMHSSIRPARLYEYGTELGELAAHTENVHVHERPELINKVIIDAPDIDSYRTEHRETVMSLLPRVDVILYVVTPFSYKDDIGWTTVLKERGRRAFAFVMNKWDAEGMPRIAPGEPGPNDDFLQLVKSRAGYDNPQLFLTSAQYHTTPQAERASISKPAPGENFDALKQWLEQGLSTSRIEQIQRRRRRSLWGALSGAVAEAMPPAIDIDGARDLAIPEIDAMVSEGVAMWRPAIMRRAEALARRREEEGRPHSPGPFGRLSSLVGAVVNAGQSWRKVADPQPDLTVEEIQDVAARSAELASRRLSGIEWKFREMKIPADNLSQLTDRFLADFENRLGVHFERASTAILEKIIRPWRITAGWVILIVFELLTVGLLGLAAWRLVEAFISGMYLDLKFTLNLVALIITLLMAGSAVMAVLFPPVKTRLRRDLEKAMRSEWMEASDRLTVQVDQFLERLRQLRDTGQDLLDECNSHVTEITREMNAVDDADTARLFTESDKNPAR